MYTTAENLNRLRIIGQTYYHPVLWYLPEYLDQCEHKSSSLLNSLRRMVTIKRLPLPPIVENKQIITKITLTQGAEGKLKITYNCLDQNEAIEGGMVNSQTLLIRELDKETLFKYVDLFDVFYNRNHNRGDSSSMELVVSNRRDRRVADKQTTGLTQTKYHLYTSSDLNELLIQVLQYPDTRVTLGKHFLMVSREVKTSEATWVNYVFFEPVKDIKSRTKKSVCTEQVTTSQLLDILSAN